jgi:hypothetical protein
MLRRKKSTVGLRTEDVTGSGARPNARGGGSGWFVACEGIPASSMVGVYTIRVQHVLRK